MALSPGARLGPYQILTALGAGGMGEVYRARDPKLNRDVAIKVLPESFANDPDRLVRFQREAQVLASLNHPNIGGIYGLEEAAGVRALVLELVEGPTLADRIAQGSIPLDEALPIAKQIAEALEAAHERGIIHRDLKPANIKVRPDGTVKVLDFGLAKATETAPGAVDLTHSPTLSMMATQAGVILGTAAYMSPEQAKGLPADQRSDVFSFGSVLYEMLTGRQPFKGDTGPDLLASVLVREPDLDLLPPNLNPRIPELLRRCLEKNPKKRWQAVGDLRVEIEAIAVAPRVAPAIAQVIAPTQPLWRRAIPVVAAAIVVGALSSIGTLYFKPSTTPPATIARFAFTLGEGQQLTNANRHVIAISPDGTKVAYAANSRVYLRATSEFEARPIPGTENTQGRDPSVSNPTFSPDGKSIAFWTGTDRTIKQTAVTGGAAVTICSATNPYGMTWGADGIVFSQPEGIMRVTEAGQPKRLVDAAGEGVMSSPQMLPDGQTLLFTLGASADSRDRGDQGRIVVQSLRSGERKTVFEDGRHARYVPSGHLVFARSGVLFAVRFDVKRLAVTGREVPIVEGVSRGTVGVMATALFSVSDSGSLIYVPGPASASSNQSGLAYIDRKGVVEPLKVPPSVYEYPRISPDATRLVFGTSDGTHAVISTYELSGTSMVRQLTFEGNNRFPIWSPDGSRVAFQSDRLGHPAVFLQRADGSGTAEPLTKPDPGTSHTPESWSPDGDVLLFGATKGSISSLWTYSFKDRKAAPFGDVKDSTLPTNAMFSPDGRWVAYQIGRAGVIEGSTWVQPFPPDGSRHLIEREGGRPLWSRDGKELFFVPAPLQLRVVTVKTAPSFTVTSPVAVPRGFGGAPPFSPRTFDIMPNGRIVAVVTAGQIQDGSPAQAQVQEIRVVLNWFEELKSKVPTK